MNRTDRADWPKAKRFNVIQTAPTVVDIVAQQKSTPEELEEVAKCLVLDMIAFEMAGRKPS